MTDTLILLLPAASLWLIIVTQRFENAVRDAKHAEEIAEIGQSSRDPTVRGQSIGKNISASRNRIRIFVETLALTVLPMLIASLAAIGTAFWLASQHF